MYYSAENQIKLSVFKSVFKRQLLFRHLKIQTQLQSQFWTPKIQKHSKTKLVWFSNGKSLNIELLVQRCTLTSTHDVI